MNALIEHIEDDLLLGMPVDLARSDAGPAPTGAYYDERRWPKERVWAQALLKLDAVESGRVFVLRRTAER